MLKIKNYVKAESLEQAYELNQKRTACVLGGMVWLKMGNRNIMTAIDLSGLGLDTITETVLSVKVYGTLWECSFETVPQWAEVFSEDSDFPMY